jgi:Conjugative transposon protein TcpC
MATGNQVLPGVPAADEREPGRTRHDRSRPGSGGRWVVWSLRIVAWAVLLLIGYRGVLAIVTGSTTSSGRAPAASQPPGSFPVSLAQAYAMAFGQVYLNFSPASAATRSSELADFLPPGADPSLGWDGAGTQSLQFEQVAGVNVLDAQHAVVKLLARVGGRLIELGVPIYSASGGLVVSGLPALLPPPARVVPPARPARTSDPATETTLAGQLPPFFRAFASGDKLTLGRFLASGAQVSGLDGAVAFSNILQISVPAGGAVRDIEVTVVWRLAGPAAAGSGSPVSSTPAQIQMTYAMTVVQQSGTWYVRSISASAELPGSS